MDEISSDILNCVNEGIIITNKDLIICLWSNYMEHITGISKGQALQKNVYDVLPNLNKIYIKKSIDNIIENGGSIFFSAAMHENLFNIDRNFNFKISKFEKNKCELLMFEFIDVTNQFVRIRQLKEYVNNLRVLNKKLQDKEKIIRNLAYYDKLTNIPNRTLFYKLANKYLSDLKNSNNLLALMFVDIDNFKTINDTYGHEVGDKVLIEVANLLTKCTRKNDIVARFGGDEFLILLPQLKRYKDYNIVISRIINEKNNSALGISLSIGISFYPCDGITIDELISNADKAMYNSKKCGGNTYSTYSLD